MVTTMLTIESLTLQHNALGEPYIISFHYNDQPIVVWLYVGKLIIYYDQEDHPRLNPEDRRAVIDHLLSKR